MILDTNALSAFLEADAKLQQLLQAHPDIALPVVVLGEYRFGLFSSRIRERVEVKLDALEAMTPALQVDSGTARLYAQIRHELKIGGHPIPENDIWIAALARQHHLPIASRDAHFDAVKGIQRLAW